VKACCFDSTFELGCLVGCLNVFGDLTVVFEGG